METFVHRYLSTYYLLKKVVAPFEQFDHNIYKIIDKCDNSIYWQDLSEELTTIFGVNNEEAISYVYNWGMGHSCPLSTYFGIKEGLFLITFPDCFIPSQPTSLHIDFIYDKGTRFEKIKRKIKDISENILGIFKIK